MKYQLKSNHKPFCHDQAGVVEVNVVEIRLNIKYKFSLSELYLQARCR